jgi:hypothetical protein
MSNPLDDDELRDIDPQTLRLWSEQTRVTMAYQRRLARLLREQVQAEQRAWAALAASAANQSAEPPLGVPNEYRRVPGHSIRVQSG